MSNDNLAEGIFGLFVALALISVLPGVMESAMETGNSELEAEIQKQEKTIQNLRNRIDTLQARNENISQRYERLVEQNVTKKDIEEIERELNQTSYRIQVLNQKFETINQQFISSYQKTVNKYQLWMGVSLFSISFLAFDVIGGAIFGRSFTDRISSVLNTAGSKVRKRFSESSETPDNSEEGENEE